MTQRRCTIHALIRREDASQVGFFLQEHARWKNERGSPYLTLPTKKTVAQPNASSLDGQSVEFHVDALMQQDLLLHEDQYALDQELDPTALDLVSPGTQLPTHYDTYPVDVLVLPAARSQLARLVPGEWRTAHDALDDPRVSLPTKAVFHNLLTREQALVEQYQKCPEAELRPEAPRRLLQSVPDRPSMDMLAKKWHARNRTGVRCLHWQELEPIMAAGDRAFNLLVADPYLRYQNQGYGLTWSFFSHKDGQDLHVHGAPVVEIYGVLAGHLEIWWKPYHARGAGAWSRRVLGPFDWAEVSPLQCHLAHWLDEGIGVVFKASPGPLAGVGPIGCAGKTKCEGCPCRKPPELVQIEMKFKRPK